MPDKLPDFPASVVLEPNHSLPLCRLQVTLSTGAATDAAPAIDLGLANKKGAPKTLDGLCNFATELQRRGAGGRSRAALDEAIDALGASVHVMCWHDQVIF